MDIDKFLEFLKYLKQEYEQLDRKVTAFSVNVGKSKKFRAIIAVVELWGHPLTASVAFALVMNSGFYTTESTNVVVVNPIYFTTLCLLFGVLRFVYFHLRTVNSGRWEAVDAFVSANYPALGSAFLVAMLYQPIEGNAFAFIFVPLLILMIPVITLVIWNRSYKAIRKLNVSDEARARTDEL